MPCCECRMYLHDFIIENLELSKAIDSRFLKKRLSYIAFANLGYVSKQAVVNLRRLITFFNN